MTTRFVLLKMLVFAFGLSSLLLLSCGGNENNKTEEKSSQPTYNPNTNTENTSTETTTTDEGKGVGPVKDVEIPATIDKAMAVKGKAIFESKCTLCHNSTDEKKIGPGLHMVTDRHKPEWIMNMILNPENMVQNDSAAKQLLAIHKSPMANQHLTEEEARAVYEFFRSNDKK